MENALTKLGLIAAIVSLAACETIPPTVDTEASVDQMSYDGLYPMNNTRVDQAWAREDLDLAGYNRFMIQSAGIQYRPVKASAGSRYAASRGVTEFPINLKQRQRLEDALRESFTDELGGSDRLEIVSEPGPDVLLVRGALLDVVSHVPPERTGRGGVFIDSVGEATLLVELVESETGTVLVRALDRRSAEQQGRMTESNSVSNMAEVRRLTRSWARLLRSRLEDILDQLGVAVES